MFDKSVVNCAIKGEWAYLDYKELLAILTLSNQHKKRPIIVTVGTAYVCVCGGEGECCILKEEK